MQRCSKCPALGSLAKGHSSRGVVPSSEERQAWHCRAVNTGKTSEKLAKASGKAVEDALLQVLHQTHSDATLPFLKAASQRETE